MKKAPASVGMQRLVEFLGKLANREAEGGEDGGDGGQSDVYDDAPLVFILVGHCCDFS